MTDHADIRARLSRVTCERLGKTEAEVTDTASFVDDLGADSLDRVELIFDLEEEFDVDISDDEVENIKTVGAALALVEKLVAAK